MLTPIHKAQGTTHGERQLAKLTEASFFGLWSYASIQRKISKGGRSFAHEVVDLAVVFGNDLILFSEKDIKFPVHEDIKVAWGRWLRQSVIESADQLRGAAKHMISGRYPLFLDAKCTQPFPFTLGVAETRIHLVAICRNSAEPAERYFRQVGEEGAQDSSGTLAFEARLSEQEMLDNPFWVGDLSPKKPFVHVFDEVAIELLMTQLDTGPDFIDYLTVRERAIRAQHLAKFYGEEDFLAIYLGGMQPTGYGSFQTDAPDDETWLELPEGQWQSFRASPVYAIQEELLRAASFWKRLTNDFSKAILTATVGEASELPLEVHERAARVLASENRASRAGLGSQLLDKYNTVPTNVRSARLAISSPHPRRLYIFLFFPWNDDFKTYEGYREVRMRWMKMYAAAAQLKYPEYSEIAILGADPKGSRGSSETFLVVQGAPELSDADKAETRAMMKEFRVLTDMGPPMPSAYSPDRSGRSQTQQRTEQKSPGVNDPCSCGSGKKFKKCCRP